MNTLAQGTLADRPWGTTLFGMGRRGVTGQLVVTSGEQRCCIAWRDGAIVGATSSFPADALARIALTNRIVTSAHTAEITRRIAAAGDGADEIEIAAAAAGLSPAQADKLRRRVIEQRAARTFAIDDGSFVLDDHITIPVSARHEIDVRAVIYLGAHMQLSEERLAIELRQLGSHFTLAAEADNAIHRFGFSDAERPILHALRAGTSVPELDTVRELDPRIVRAVIYALATCDAVTRVSVARVPTPPIITPRTPTNPNVSSDRHGDADRQSVGRADTQPAAGIAIARVPTVRPSSPRIETEPGRFPPTDPAIPRTTTPISEAQRRLAAEAYERGRRAIDAEAFDQAALELARACELAPNNVDHQALYAWARFTLATDKELAAADTRKVLEAAVRTSATPVVARFHLGRVERIVGREREALRHFREVLAAEPNHAAAANEIRLLEARLAANSKR